MKAYSALALSALIAAPAALAVDNSYSAGQWVVRGGLTQTEPREDSDNIKANGEVLLLGGTMFSDGQPSSVGIDNDIQLGLTVEYMLDANWGLELLAATPFEHTATGKGAIGGLEIADFKHLPPTLSAVYHFTAINGFQPYVGAGINYTFIYDEELTSDAKAAFSGLGLEGGKMKLDDSIGPSLQVGADYHVNDTWLINVSARWIDLDTEAKIKFNGGTTLTSDIEVDPMVYTVSVGYKF